MKTYYIPTSSLNFNNILSSESISPKAFYQNRSFGYGRWASIPENPYDNSIVLYDQIGFFDRPKSDYEDHPLLVEAILDDAQESRLLPIDEHAALCDFTIYLDPFSTKFFFFSENDWRVALSLSDSSIETKFVRLYQKKISVIPRPSYTYSLPESSSEKQPLNLNEIEKDKRINRMKGLLYGYYIGGLLSGSRDDVVKLNTLREIQNILAAILASFEHKATPQQRTRLKELYSGLQPEIPFFTKLSSLVSERSLFDAIVSLVRGEYGYIRGEFDVDRKISQLLAAASQEGMNPVMEEIGILIRQTENAMASKVHPISVLDGELVLGEGFSPSLNLPSLPDEEKTLYKAWIAEVLSKDEYSGKISTFKETLSDDVTRKAKEVCKTEWKGSYPEVTLNALRRHVRGDEFNHVWNNDVLSSLAAVIIRGDDWQKLLQFMQERVMTDYRIAFSMYGTINGFANLPRDFTDILFSRDSRYIADVYREIYGQLFGKDITTPTKSAPILTETPPTTIVEDMPDFTNEGGIKDSPETKPVTMGQESPIGFDSLMSEIVAKCTGAKKDERIYKDLYIRYGGLTLDFFEAVKADASLNKGKGVQQGVRQLLQKKVKPMKDTKPKKERFPITQIRTETSLFADSEQSTGVFLSDLDFLSNNMEFITIMSRAKKKWIEDLIWFIEAHKPESEDSYYKGKPTDNKTVINQFINLKKGLYREAKDFLFKTYSING